MSIGLLPTVISLSISFVFSPFITDIVLESRFDKYIFPVSEFTVDIYAFCF